MGRIMTRSLLGIAFVLLFSLVQAQAQAPKPGISFSVSFPAARSATALDGRVILLVSTDPTVEPRAQVDADSALKAPFIFGLTVDGLKPGQSAIVDASAFGWPAQSLSSLKPGDYTVQAVLNRYETFHRADGSVVKLPPDKGEGQNWAAKPGNLYSKPMKVYLDPAHVQRIALVLDRQIAPIAPKTDTVFVRHVMIRSELLSKFWGRPIYIGAHVLVPLGFDAHPNAHFPLMVFHGHFPDDISDFRTTPPDPNLKPDYSERFHLAGYNRIQQQEDYAFYKKWISPGFPRFLVIEVEHANPYYDDSYAVNSANLGPYGDAINKELIPYIEKKFRGLGQGWARFTYGGSTGGWEALATQVFYPDMFNGSFAACPDPIDFRAYTVINLYTDKNAYSLQGQALSIERPSARNYLGEVLDTQRSANHMELALGDHSRSGGQYDIWQAVFGPEGADGYPKPIFDKATGEIDHGVAAYWREHYDLSHIIQRDWAVLGPKLAGKIHIYVGSADTYYLNNAVYFAQATLESLKNPAYGGEVDYGDRAEHCWNGDHRLPNAYSRLHYNTLYLPKILARIQATAPKGADLTSWRY
jgi:Putative esterase